MGIWKLKENTIFQLNSISKIMPVLGQKHSDMGCKYQNNNNYKNLIEIIESIECYLIVESY